MNTCPCRVAKELRTVEEIMEYEQELASDKGCRTPDDSAKAATEDDPDCMSMDNPADLGELTQQLEQGFGANQADDLELC